MPRLNLPLLCSARCRRFSARIALAGLAFTAIPLSAQTGTAVVNHAPVLNGIVEGSLHVLRAESVTLNGNATIDGDLSVPGSPTVRKNGNPEFAGVLEGTGDATPNDGTITLNGGARLRYLIRRAVGSTLPSVAPPATPSGTRNLTVNQPPAASLDFAGLRNLTLNGNAGRIAIPPGTYGTFTANGSSRLVLGIAGSATPAQYGLQSLTLNGDTALELVGPVVLTMAGGVALNGDAGAVDRPDWLVWQFAAGGLTVNGNRRVYAQVIAPQGAVTLNGGSRLVGGLAADRLVINGNATLRLVAPGTPRLQVLGGDEQFGLAGRFNAAPFDLALWNAGGTTPLVNAPVTFRVDTGGGRLAAQPVPAAESTGPLVLVTDADGTVQAHYRQPGAPDTLSRIRAESGGVSVLLRTFSVAEGDTDGDGLPDLLEYQIGTNPHALDTDADGIDDREERGLGTDPKRADSDGDGMPDGWERSRGFDPLSSTDGALDPDGDGRTNAQEYAAGSDPRDFYNGSLPLVTSLVAGDGALGEGDTLRVRVTDHAGVPLANAPVEFAATVGGHLLAASADGPALSSVAVRTGADGIALVFVRKGATP